MASVYTSKALLDPSVLANYQNQLQNQVNTQNQIRQNATNAIVSGITSGLDQLGEDVTKSLQQYKKQQEENKRRNSQNIQQLLQSNDPYEQAVAESYIKSGDIAPLNSFYNMKATMKKAEEEKLKREAAEKLGRNQTIASWLAKYDQGNRIYEEFKDSPNDQSRLQAENALGQMNESKNQLALYGINPENKKYSYVNGQLEELRTEPLRQNALAVNNLNPNIEKQTAAMRQKYIADMQNKIENATAKNIMNIVIDENLAGDQAANLSKLWNNKKKEIINEKNQRNKDKIGNTVTELKNQISSFADKNKNELKDKKYDIEILQKQVDALSDDNEAKAGLRKEIDKIIKKMNAKEPINTWKLEGQPGNKLWYWYVDGKMQGAVKAYGSKEKL